ncbi:MAG: hypothetical protein ACR2KG_04625 [Nocardioidaceae bacterium]
MPDKGLRGGGSWRVGSRTVGLQRQQLQCVAGSRNSERANCAQFDARGSDDDLIAPTDGRLERAGDRVQSTW